MAVTTACPAVDVTSGALSSDEATARSQAQSRLQPTLQAVQRYAAAHTGVAGTVRFGGKNNLFVIAPFTDDLGSHASALRALVENPAAVVVCPVPVSAARLSAIATDVTRRAAGAFYGVETGDAFVRIQLRADRRALAAALHDEYGALVRIRLGSLPYPDRTAVIEAGGAASCGAVPAAGPQNGQLVWSTTPSTLRVNSGGDLRVQVHFRNRGKQPVRFESGATITALVTRAGSRTVLARYPGAITARGFGGTLRQGDTATVVGLLSTASCRSSLGWALPPGTYSARFVFGGYDHTATAGTKPQQFVSGPLRVVVTSQQPATPPRTDDLPDPTIVRRSAS